MLVECDTIAMVYYLAVSHGGAAMHIKQLKMQHAYGNHVKSKYIDYNYEKHIYYEILALLLANRQVFI